MKPDIEYVYYFCCRYRLSVILNLFCQRFLLLATIVFIAATVCQICFALFPWTVLPVFWDLCFVGFFAGTGIIAFDLLILRNPTLEKCALEIEQSAALSHPWISLALELSNKSTSGSKDLQLSVFEKANNSLAQCQKKSHFLYTFPKTIVLLFSFVSFCLTFFVLSPSCFRFWNLPLAMIKTIQADIYPGSIFVPTGTSCTLSCKLKAAAFPSAKLTMGNPVSGAVSQKFLCTNGNDGFSFVCDSLASSMTYKFSIGNTAFNTDTIHVVPHPSLAHLQTTLLSPKYTDIKPQTLSDGQGNFAAYPGSRARFCVKTPFPLLQAKFLPSAGNPVLCTIHGDSAIVYVTLINRLNYTFSFIDTFGQKSDSVPFFCADIIPDMPPFISFVKPAANKTCDPSLHDTLLLEALDDIGIKSVRVLTRKNHDSIAVYYNSTFVNNKTVQLCLPITLTRFSLYPGDTLFYWASAVDNCEYIKPHETTTDTFFFRVPGFEEIHRQITEEQDETERALHAVRNKQDDLQKAVLSLMKSARSAQQMSWEQQQISKDLKAAVTSQQDSLDNAIASFKQAIDKLKQQESASPQLLKRMNDIQKEIEDLRKQFGDSLFFKAPEKNEQFSMHDLRESIDKIKNMIPELSQRLDDALNFLRQLKKDQALAKLAAEASHLAQSQQNIASSQKENKLLNTAQEKQNSTIDSLLNHIDKYAETLDSSLSLRKELPSLKDVSSLQKNMKSIASQKSMPSQNDMQQMSESLLSLADNLENLQSNALSKRQNKDREIMLSMASDALNLSVWQQQINESGNSENVDAGELSSEQQEMQSALTGSMKKINMLSMLTPQSVLALRKKYDEAQLSLQKSIDRLSRLSSPIFLNAPAPSLNGLTKAMLDAVAEMDNAPSGSCNSNQPGSMQNGIQKLSGKQAALNSMTGELLRKMLGENGEESDGDEQQNARGKNSGEYGSAQQEAKENQQHIADELKRLSNQYGKEAGSSLDKKAKQLEEEARQLAKQFEHPSQELIDHQKIFLSRMMETALSQHKQDEGKEDRVSQSAKNVFNPTNQKQPFQKNVSAFDPYFLFRQRAMSGNFPDSYRLSVKKYVDALGVLFLKPASH